MDTVKLPASPDYGREIDAGAGVDIPTPNARQGVVHHNLRYGLALSLAGVVIAFTVIYLAFFST